MWAVDLCCTSYSIQAVYTRSNALSKTQGDHAIATFIQPHSTSCGHNTENHPYEDDSTTTKIHVSHYPWQCIGLGLVDKDDN